MVFLLCLLKIIVIFINKFNFMKNSHETPFYIHYKHVGELLYGGAQLTGAG